MNYSFKTISKKVMGDLHTPVSIYLKVRDIYPESALLESSDFHGNENSLSFISAPPLGEHRYQQRGMHGYLPGRDP